MLIDLESFLFKRLTFEDRKSLLPGTYNSTRSHKYHGADLDKILWLISKILNLILSWIGNQCKSCKIGVMCSLFLLRVTRRAAAF